MRRIRETDVVTNDSQGGVRGDPVVRIGEEDGTRDRSPSVSSTCDARTTAAEPEEAALRGHVALYGFRCNVCGHHHAGQTVAYICIGCPCEEVPWWIKEKRDAAPDSRKQDAVGLSSAHEGERPRALLNEAGRQQFDRAEAAEAARDHLRARLQQQIATWQRHAETSTRSDEPWTVEQAPVLLQCARPISWRSSPSPHRTKRPIQMRLRARRRRT